MPPCPALAESLRRLHRATPALAIPAAAAMPAVTRLICRDREVIRDFEARHPALVLILAGTKLLHRAGTDSRFPAPALLLLVPGEVLTVVNEPPERGPYQALVVEFDAAALAGLGLNQDGAGQRRGDPVVPMDGAVLAALAHLVEGIASAGLTPALRRHRLAELALALDEAGCGARLGQALWSTADRVLAVLRADPAEPVSLEGVAHRLNLSPAGLRRRLAAEGRGFRALRTAVRLDHARGLLAGTGLSLAEIALSCGYASPDRFARRFRTALGMSPSDWRVQARLDPRIAPLERGDISSASPWIGSASL